MTAKTTAAWWGPSNLVSIPFPAAGQSFADFARRAHVSSHRWRSAVLATPPVLDADTAEIILPSVDAFQVQASGVTLQELRSKGTKTSRSVDDFLDFNALTNTVRSTLHLDSWDARHRSA